MKRSTWMLVWLVFLLALDLALPWGVLGGVESFSGVFLFWVAWAAVAVASMFVLFLRWKE
ncbi:MAG: hypothetical protein IMY83_00580 [Chloroflexi bacterium]|nr:hypothetical protein [Chloroflexota bacterium]